MARNERKQRIVSGADRFTIGVGLLALIAGVALLAIDSDYLLSIIGACLLGLAAVAFVALAFLMVGESEDRDYGNNHHHA
ncbi:MAG TPA: hypothetical protein VGG08_04655 [Solirubrobacteraceae bacterium]|jgi:hypothetical protein